MNELAGLMKTNGKTFKGATGRDQQGDTACVRSERVDLGNECGLMARVHPLGGHLR